jgi:hypothetical protein
MNWKTRVTLIGGAIGLLLGLASAMLYIFTVQNEQGDSKEVVLPRLQPSDIMPIMITGVGLLRTIAGLGTLDGNEKKKRR